MAKLDETQKTIVIVIMIIIYIVYLMYVEKMIDYSFSVRNWSKDYVKTYTTISIILVTLIYIIFFYGILTDQEILLRS